MRRTLLAILTVVTAAALAACSNAAAEDGSTTAVRLTRPYQVPDVSLTDTSDQPFDVKTDTNAPLTVVFFGYTHCADICPMVLTNLASAMTRLDDADKSKVQVVFITSDPKSDTPTVIRNYLDRFDPSFLGLTGDFATIDSVAKPLAVGLDKINAGGHTTTTLAVTPDDQAIAYWDDTTTPSQFAADFHTLLENP